MEDTAGFHNLVKEYDFDAYLAQRAFMHLKTLKKKHPDSIVPTFSLTELITWLKTNYGKPCVYCGVEGTAIDHKIPLKIGGLHVSDNLQITCNDCNTAKWALPESLFLELIKRIYKYRKLGE